MSDGSRKDVRTKCAGCSKRIRSRYLLRAQGTTWHERCFICDACGEILYSFGGEKFFQRDGQKLCQDDYIRQYGMEGRCSKCQGRISPTERVMKFTNNLAYHVDCFSCAQCCRTFRSGDLVRIPHPDTILCVDHNLAAMVCAEGQFEIAVDASSAIGEHRQRISLEENTQPSTSKSS